MTGLAWRNIRGNAFRSLVVFLCAALVSGLTLSATLLVRGAEANLRTSLQRMGADLLLLPWGTMTEKLGGVRLMSAAIDGWMPSAYMEKIAAVEGVDEISPQLHLATIYDSPYNPQADLYVVAFDPKTDFTLRPWLERRSADVLRAGEVIAGSNIRLPEEEDELHLFGVELELADRLAATGTSIDQTLFVSFETAERMVAWSDETGSGALNIMPGSISAMMVKVELDSEPHDVAVRILEETPGIVPLETTDMFQMERRQMIGVLRALLGLLGGIWALLVIFMGLVFSMAANERRMEIGVLRALGSPKGFVLKTLLAESAILALGGGAVGALIVAFGMAFLGEGAVHIARLPMAVPSAANLAELSLAGQALALASVLLAAFLPAWRISRQEAALTMRE